MREVLAFTFHIVTFHMTILQEVIKVFISHLCCKGFLCTLDTTIDRIMNKQYNNTPKSSPINNTYQLPHNPNLPPKSRY